MMIEVLVGWPFGASSVQECVKPREEKKNIK